MTNAVKLPTVSDLKTFQASQPTFQVPALQYGLNDTDVTSTVVFNGILKDGAGATVTGGFLGTAKTSTGYAEYMWFPLSSSSDGQTFTGVVRGIKLSGIDYTVGTSGNVVQHFAGEEFFVGVSAVIDNMIRDAVQGVIATGGTSFAVGDGASGNKTYSIYNNTGTIGILRNTGTKTQYSDDGSVWVNISDTAASVVVKVSATDTTAGYLNDKIDTATAGRLTKSIGSPAGNEKLQLTLATTLTDAEMNQMHGISANVTSTSLNTLTAGASSDASSLHTHPTQAISLTVGESIDGSTNAIPVGMSVGGKDSIVIANSTAFGDPGGGFSTINWGNTDAVWKYAQSFTYTNAYASAITLSFVTVCMRKVAAPTDNITVTIQSDDGTGKPSGTVITNGTSNTVDGSTLTSTASRYNWVQFTFATPPTLTSGTRYHIVMNRVSAPDAVNYYQIITYGADVYASQKTSSYTLSTTTWTNVGNNDLAMYLEMSITGDGKVYKLDADNLNSLNYIGWTKSNVTSGNAASVIVGGAVDTLTGLTAGRTVYASTTAGSYSHTPPSAELGAIIPLGVATSSTSIYMNKSGASIGNSATTISNATTGTSALHTNEVASGTLTVFIKTGFRPKRVTATGTTTDTSITVGSHIVTIDQTTALHNRVTSLNASNQFVSLQSASSLATSNAFLPGTIVDNGFYITVSAANYAGTQGTTLNGFIAEL